MAILVVCRNCMARFSVSEQFAGRKGPCPKCKAVIEIPKLEEQVKVHAPEHSEAGARSKTGELLLKPVSREKIDVPTMTWVIIGVAALSLLLVAVALRFMESPPLWLIGGGAWLLGPPLAVGGYFFLRNDELEAYGGRELWVRACICGTVHALFWLAFYYIIVPAELHQEFVYWAFFLPPLVAIGGTASFASLDLDYFSGIMHCCFYLLATGLLAWVMGMPLFG